MFAVIKTGGKQYKVSPNNVIKIERLEAQEGSVVEFEHILMIGDSEKTTIGSPVVSNAKVTAEVLEHFRGDKVIIFKKKRRKSQRRKTGHRQDLTKIKITNILVK